MALKNIADLIGLKGAAGARGNNSGRGSQVATGGQTAGKVGSGAAENSRLLQVVSQYVPNEVVPYLCFVRLENGQLRITVDNAGAATRIRFAGQQVKNALSRSEGIPVTRVSVHVKPQEKFQFQQRRTDLKPNPVSGKTIQLIESAAVSIEKSGAAESADPSTEDAAAKQAKRAEDIAEIVGDSAGDRAGEAVKDPLAAALKRLAAAMAGNKTAP